MKCAVLLIVAGCMLAVVTCAVTNHEKTTEDVNTDDNDTQEGEYIESCIMHHSL